MESKKSTVIIAVVWIVIAILLMKLAESKSYLAPLLVGVYIASLFFFLVKEIKKQEIVKSKPTNTNPPCSVCGKQASLLHSRFEGSTDGNNPDGSPYIPRWYCQRHMIEAIGRERKEMSSDKYKKV